MPNSREDIKHAHTIELRFYRGTMMSLMGLLSAVSIYIATTTVETSKQLPAIQVQLVQLNNNLGELKDIPLQTQANALGLKDMDRRVAWLERYK